jgi:branched-chain amino acid transport system ATP-binding protein
MMDDTHALKAAPFLCVERLRAGYGLLRVLDDVSLAVDQGDTLALLGHNGSGKSTLLKAIFGTIGAWSGNVRLRDEEITGWSVRQRLRAGIAYVPQYEEIFRDLTVLDNVRTAGLASGEHRPPEDLFASASMLFPVLAKRRNQIAGTLSGGERKMLGIALALVRRPSIVLLDEPSVGLAPPVVDSLYARLTEIQSEQGLTIIMAEQNVLRAVRWTQRTMILRAGCLHWEGMSADLLQKGDLEIARAL